jgi:glucose-1-phosphate thymidylyltransferase
MEVTRGLILSTEDNGWEDWPLIPVRRALAPVANSALITLQLRALHGAGIREVGIVGDPGLAGALHDAVRDSALEVDLVHISPPKEAGLARRLLAAEAFIGGAPFVAELTGSFTEHDRRRSVEVLERYRLGALIIAAESGTRDRRVMSLPGVGPGDPACPAEAAFAGANAFVFGNEVFDAARRAIDTPLDESPGIGHVLEVLAENPDRVRAVSPTGWSKRVDNVQDLLEANRLVLRSLARTEVSGTSARNRVMGPAVVDETAMLESSVLNGPVAIAAGACITDSYIGPYTAIGAGARIDGAEIERSVVLPAAWIGSIGFRIEGSVIGTRARITRNLAPPRALQLCVGQDARVSLA